MDKYVKNKRCLQVWNVLAWRPKYAETAMYPTKGVTGPTLELFLPSLCYKRLIANLKSQLPIHHLHISHNAPYLRPKTFAKALFSIFLEKTVIPRRNEKTKVMKNLGEQIRCIMGDVQVAYTPRWSKWKIIENVKSKNDFQTKTL